MLKWHLLTAILLILSFSLAQPASCVNATLKEIKSGSEIETELFTNQSKQSVTFTAKFREAVITANIRETSWIAENPVLVELTIENYRKKAVELPLRLVFKLTNAGARREITMRDGAYWAPVSLTKKYETPFNGCMNSFSNEQVKQVDETNITEISPSKRVLRLKAKEKQQFSFNLTAICWQHQISSYWPDKSIFSLAKPGSYELYLEIAIPLPKDKNDFPDSRHIESGRVKISIENKRPGESKTDKLETIH